MRLLIIQMLNSDICLIEMKMCNEYNVFINRNDIQINRICIRDTLLITEQNAQAILLCELKRNDCGN